MFQKILSKLYKMSVYFIALGLTGLSLVGCGSGSGSGTLFATADSIPESTGEVIDGSSASLSAATIQYLGASSTGMLLGETTSSDFTTDKSRGACEMFNQTKTAIAEAVQAELVQCYVTSTFDVFANANNINIYDGQEHIFDLDFEGSSFDNEEQAGGPSKIKIKFTRTNGSITDFEFWACEDAGASDVQNEYINKSIDGTNFSAALKHAGSQGTQTYANEVLVTATLDGNGNFVDEVNGEPTPKIITAKHTFEDTGENSGDFWMNMIFSWSADSAEINGTFEGTFGDCTFSDTIFSSLDLADTNDEGADPWEVGLLELRDGALKGTSVGECDGSGSWNDTYEDAWDGINATTLDDITESDHYSTVNDATLEVQDEPSIAFSGDEVWNCSGEAEATISFAELEADGVNIATSCSHLELNHEYIECYNIAAPN